MCKWCDWMFEDNWGDDMPEFVDTKLEINGVEVGYLDVGLDRRIDDPLLATTFSIGGEPIIMNHLRIHYCPICGRKLD